MRKVIGFFTRNIMASYLMLVTVTVPAMAEMTLTSTDIAPEQTMDIDQVFSGFGCEGKNLSPSLSWSGAPVGTKSFVVTAYDPDAPTGSGWWHWSVFNIPSDVTQLPEGVGTEGMPLPDRAVVARNDYSQNAFGGACPPKGNDPHRYVFTVYAMLREALPIDSTASGALVGFYANNSSLESVSITAYYGR
ncbi:MAG: YbhB/YbcL family Raf kinase inhibitor-like protein [Alphaproteobacteria bacterium]|nr:YbhB/YbcL family Raf kinase inhibitor-like protein [Alphaproteobacteria bacterium]